MLIEDADAFKTWLGKTLQPICDADPEALAKYVIALVKKDKQEEELRTSCFDQLEVFLQDKTKNFVTTLFEALKSKTYIQAANNRSPALPPSNSSVKSEPRKSSRSDEGSDDHRRKRSHSRSPGRDRDRSRRNYDDRRRNDNDRGSRSHSRYDSDYRSRHRTRSRSRSPRSRSPRQRSRSIDRSKHKSRSPDRIPVHVASDSRGSTPVQDDTKDPPRGPVISSEIIVPPHSGYHGRERPPPRPRCRDYDEKGFCMRGDLCPFDHGVDPVVLDDVVTFNSGGPPPSGPRGPSPGPPGGPHGPPGGPPHGPPGGPHGPPGGPRGPPGPPHGLPGGLHDHRGPPPPHHMPPMPQEQSGPRPLRPMLHHGPPPTRPPPLPQGPPPQQQGPPPPGPPALPPHPGDHAHVSGPSQGTVIQLGGVESTRLPPSQAPSAFRPLPPPSQQLPPQQGPPPPSTQSMRTEYQPEPYNPEAPMLRNKTNDFWRGNHGRGRGRGRGHDRGGHGHDRGGHGHDRGGHGHDRGGHGHDHDRSGHGNERDMERDRMRHQFQPQHPRRDLVSIPTIPEPSEEEPPTVAPQNNSGGREGGGVASRVVVVPSKRKYEMSGEPDEDIDAMPYKQQHMMQPHPQHHPPPHHQQHHPPPHHQQHHMQHHQQHHQGPPQQQPWGNTGPGHKKPHFDFKRLGPQRRVHANPDNCTLELRRVPREHNNIAKLNEHFSKFGHIVNLQVCYEGDNEAALITFGTNAQALSAYRSPEPVLNNRFIKVFWHQGATDEGGEAEAGASNEPTKLSIKERLGEIPPPHKLQLNNNKPAQQPPADGNSKKVVVSPLGLTKTVFNLTAMKKGSINTRLGSQPPQQLKQQARQQEQQLRQQLQAGLVQKKKQQEQEMMKKKMAIQKEKQLLLHKQINKQKLLIGKLESKDTTPEQKTKIMKTIKTLADIIETLKTDLTTSTPKPKAVPVKQHLPRTKQEAQKEILDTELDIIAKQNEGADTSALRKRVAALKKEATVLGLLGHGARGRGALRGGRGRGATRGGRGGHSTTLSVDRRPKQLLVVGFEPAEKDAVVELLSKDGGVETVLHDDAAVTMVITYQTRLQAEQAITTAGEYDKAQLRLSWYKPGSGSGDCEVAAPISVQDEALLTEVTGQVLSRHNSLAGEVEEEGPEEVIVPGAGPEEPVIEDDDDDDEDVLRVGEGEDEENMPGGIGDHELDDEMDEDLLLGVDEEEDEEEEGRSWRR